MEALGAPAGDPRVLAPKELGGSCAGSGRAPPFAVAHEPQGKVAKRSVTVQTKKPKDPEVRGALDITLQRWAAVVERWVAEAGPATMPRWLSTDESKLGAKGETFVVQLKEWEDPVSFAWPFDSKHPLGLLVDMLTVTHRRGTQIVAVTAKL